MQSWELARDNQPLNRVAPLMQEDAMSYMPEVVQAIAAADYRAYAYFSDGSVRLVDVAPLIAKGGVFAALAHEGVFEDAITVMNYAVAWDLSGKRDPANCIDLDPIETYESGIVVEGPLVTVA